MAVTMSPEESIALIKSNLAEVLNGEIIDRVILEEKRPLKVYWGTATTGRPHCGYFVPMIKLAELLKAGCEVTVLIADIHGYLDNMKAPFEIVEYRAKYYTKTITALLKAIGVDISKLRFVLGSSYQLSKEYTLDRFKLEGTTRVKDAQKAGAEVVKQLADDACLGGLIYPLMQALDEEYLGVDVQFGGVDQRKIFTFALENLPKLGYKVRAHLMNKMVPSLGAGAKMSASDPNSKIDLLDSAEAVQKKLKKAVCEPKVVEGNGLVAFVEHVLFRAIAIKYDGSRQFTVERRDGEPLVYDDVEKMKADYTADILTPQLIKTAVATHLNELLEPLRQEYAASAEWQAESEQAYPSEKAAPKTKKDGAKPKGGDPAMRARAEAARAAQAVSGVQTNPDGSVEGKNAERVNLGGSNEETLKALHLDGDAA